ncbi:MAG: response regulator [Treponema sp.]|jgi:two-component system response regulator YesN|nr:response regulator [Treponema sp.]
MYKVFLVEDEIVVREGIRNSIPWEKTPYTLVGDAPDGEMALPLIAEQKPDILITDIKMPFMDGIALSGIVKKNMPRIKIIILSGHDEFEYARKAISIGVEEYLLKPLSAKDMLATLDRIAQRIDQEKENRQNIEELAETAQALARALSADAAAAPEHQADIKADAEENGREEKRGDDRFDEKRLLAIDGEALLARLKYAAKKDIGGIISDYEALLKTMDSEDEMMKYYLFGEVLAASAKIIEDLKGNVKEVLPFGLVNRREIREIIGSHKAFVEKLSALLGALVEFKESRSPGRYQSVILKARAYIDQHYAENNVSLQLVADQVGISPNHFSSVFVSETGENFIDYLTRVRIDRAKHLLAETNIKSADIAYETGWSDPHYFSFIFKKNTGFSPREYRRRKITQG